MFFRKIKKIKKIKKLKEIKTNEFCHKEYYLL